MPFYKFILNVGHFGAGHRQEVAVYIYAKSYMNAMKNAKQFPAVQHNAERAIIKSNVIDELEFVTGILKNGYGKVMYDASDVATLKQNVRTLSYIKNYKFVTDEGKCLKDFCDRYKKADPKQQHKIEQEYNNWAQNIIDARENDLLF